MTKLEIRNEAARVLHHFLPKASIREIKHFDITVGLLKAFNIHSKYLDKTINRIYKLRLRSFTPIPNPVSKILKPLT